MVVCFLKKVYADLTKNSRVFKEKHVSFFVERGENDFRKCKVHCQFVSAMRF